MTFGNRPFAVLALLSAALPFTLTGCSASFSPTLNEPGTYTIHGIQGTVFGGQQPVSGASVYLYATGTSGLYSNSRSVLTAAVLLNPPSTGGIDGNLNYFVTTSSTGHFAITGDYTCSSGESLYLYATGGNSGAGTGSNSHIGMLAALGTCISNSGDLSGQVSSIQVNEISTIATAYALAGFGHTSTSIGSGSSATAQQAMVNAFANVPNIYNDSAGMPLSTTAGSTASATGTVPSNKMLWLADIIGACLNTDPNDSNSTCANLFAAMPNPFGGTTADTAQVALNMAHTQSPSAATITTLTGLIPTQPAFPYTATSYTDLALPVVYSIAALREPAAIAIDANGNVWIPDVGQTDLPVYELSPQGAGSSFTPAGAGTTDFTRIAISPQDDSLWFFNAEGDTVVSYSNAGVFRFTATVPGGDHVPAGGLAFDGSGNVYFPAGSGSPSKFVLVEDSSSNASVATGASTTFGGTPFITLDSNLDVWFAGTSKFFEFNSPYTGTPTSISNSYGNFTIYTGANGLIWYPGSSTGVESITSSATTGPTCTGGGLSLPQSVAIDGAGNLWAGSSNTSGNPQTISGFSTTASTCTALTTTSGISNGVDPSLDPVPWYIAADSSGNIWTANYGINIAQTANVFTFTQFLGLSVPAVTPINPALVGATPQ